MSSLVAALRGAALHYLAPSEGLIVVKTTIGILI
jgi:hypothetical protein